MRWPYANIGVVTTRTFRNLLNKIHGDIAADMQEHKDRADNLQGQINELVVNGDSSPQAAQASIGADGTDYNGNLKARLDAEYNKTTTQLADIFLKIGDTVGVDVDDFKIQVPEEDDSGLIQRAIESLPSTGGTLIFKRKFIAKNLKVDISKVTWIFKSGGSLKLFIMDP